MTTAEHLIENALVQYEKSNDYNLFINNKILKEQSNEIGISLEHLYQMVVYIHSTYKMEVVYETTQKLVEDYGYNIYKDEENY